MQAVIIELTRGKVAQVDASDWRWLNARKWHAYQSRKKWRAEHSYRCSQSGRTVNVLMHRMILGAKPGDIVDHVNGDSLDNRRSNLRFATAKQNAANRDCISESGYLGVCKCGAQWSACISDNRRTVNLGMWDTPELAASAYNRAASIVHGEFARLNQVEPMPSIMWAKFIEKKRRRLANAMREMQLLEST